MQQKDLSVEARAEQWNIVMNQWEAKKASHSTQTLILMGIPPNLRGKIWAKYIGNTLQVTPELFGIFRSHAKRVGSPRGPKSGV